MDSIKRTGNDSNISGIFVHDKKKNRTMQKTEPQDTVNLSSEKAPEKELTILYYMHGQYDDIGKATGNAMIDLEKAGSDENMNLIAQLGRNPVKIDNEDGFHIPIDGDWEGVRRYEIRQDSHKDLDVPMGEWIKLEQEMPDNPILQFVLGDEYWAKGDKETARVHYDKARACGMNHLIKDYNSDESKAIRKEFNEKTRHLDEAMADKKVFASEMLKEMPPETRMGEPAVLKDFISWGMEKYPAKKYMLVVMAHGGGWMGAAEMGPSQMGKAILEGIEDSNRKTGRNDKLDATVFNSCYMGNLESAYQMKDTADVTLVSENYATTGVFNKWSGLIGDIQKDLKEGKPFDVREFAGNMVESFRERGREVKENFPDFAPWKRDYLTLSAIDNKKLESLVESWKHFLDSCQENNVTDKQLFSAVQDAKNYPSGAYNPRQVFGFYDQIRDLGSIMDNIKKSEDIPKPVKTAAENVKTALKNSIIAEQHEGIDMEGSQGLTLWGPTNAVDILFMKENYNKDVPDFPANTGWGDRLQSAADNVPKKVINGFLDSYRQTRKLKEELKQDGISPEKKEKLSEELRETEDRMLKYKEQMDFTLERDPDIYKSKEKVKISAEELGNIADYWKRKIPEQDGMKQYNPREH